MRKMCVFHILGVDCTRGARCAFSHAPRLRTYVCKAYLNGHCLHSFNCVGWHPGDPTHDPLWRVPLADLMMWLERFRQCRTPRERKLFAFEMERFYAMPKSDAPGVWRAWARQHSVDTIASEMWLPEYRDIGGPLLFSESR